MSENEAPRGDDLPCLSLLALARVACDPVYERGRTSRGAYISDSTGTKYLNHRGEWTNGIVGDENWWNHMGDAHEFLAKELAKARANIGRTGPAASDGTVPPVVRD